MIRVVKKPVRKIVKKRAVTVVKKKVLKQNNNKIKTLKKIIKTVPKAKRVAIKRRICRLRVINGGRSYIRRLRVHYRRLQKIAKVQKNNKIVQRKYKRMRRNYRNSYKIYKSPAVKKIRKNVSVTKTIKRVDFKEL